MSERSEGSRASAPSCSILLLHTVLVLPPQFQRNVLKFLMGSRRCVILVVKTRFIMKKSTLLLIFASLLFSYSGLKAQTYADSVLGFDEVEEIAHILSHDVDAT